MDVDVEKGNGGEYLGRQGSDVFTDYLMRDGGKGCVADSDLVSAGLHF